MCIQIWWKFRPEIIYGKVGLYPGGGGTPMMNPQHVPVNRPPFLNCHYPMTPFFTLLAYLKLNDPLFYFSQVLNDPPFYHFLLPNCPPF